MNYCQDCGSKVTGLNTRNYGCGGRGSLKVCIPCDQIWEQSSGGILPTPGGETYSRFYIPFSEYRKRLIENIKPYMGSEDGKWYYWDELYDQKGPYETQEEASWAIAIYYKEHDKTRCYTCDELVISDTFCENCMSCEKCQVNIGNVDLGCTHKIAS
tara:strand:+ start:192 stop:662 length:471 start_codon:yes stop_codon:yes gene_type:complete